MLDQVLTELKGKRGIDLSGYRHSMLERSLAARITHLGCDEASAYLERLRNGPTECGHLIEAVAINVSSFFRNPLDSDRRGRYIGDNLDR